MLVLIVIIYKKTKIICAFLQICFICPYALHWVYWYWYVYYNVCNVFCCWCMLLVGVACFYTVLRFTEFYSVDYAVFLLHVAWSCRGIMRQHL